MIVKIIAIVGERNYEKLQFLKELNLVPIMTPIKILKLKILKKFMFQ